MHAQITSRTVRVLDVAVAVWLMACLLLGLIIWNDIRSRLELSERLIATGVAIEETGSSFSSLRDLPFAGDSFAGLQSSVESAGRRLVESGNDIGRGTRQIAFVIGAGIGTLLAGIVLLLYMPFRIGWRRDVHAVAAALAVDGGTPGFERYLAHRALVTLPWQRLSGLSDDPWRSLSSDEAGRLAHAELVRLGLAQRR